MKPSLHCLDITCLGLCVEVFSDDLTKETPLTSTAVGQLVHTGGTVTRYATN